MGTSSSYGGPTGGNPLLPAWAQQSGEPAPDQNKPTPDRDGSDDAPEQPEANETPDAEGDAPELIPAAIPPQRTTAGPTSSYWQSAKTNMTRFAAGGGRRNLSRAGSSYVRARGGARGAAGSSRASRASTARLAGFLADVASRGTAAAVTALGVSLVGQSAETILTAIADALAPEGALLEESVARQAVDDVLLVLFERYDLENGSITNLDAVDAGAVREVIVLSVAQSIYLRWLEDLGKCIETGTATSNEALRLEREVKDYVRETLTLDLSGHDVLRVDWNGREGQQIVERIYREAYGFLEAGE